MNLFSVIKNQTSIRRADLPRLSVEEFRQAVLDKVQSGSTRVMDFFAEGRTLYAVLGDANAHAFLLTSCEINQEYPSLTADAPAFHWFERELWEQNHIRPVGHPFLKPIRFSEGVPGVTNYFTPAGDNLHEVAVGPIHAGVIEPGHFRFQCLGETVLNLEIELGYQHRGIAAMLAGGPDRKTEFLIETAAGDTSAAAMTAYSMIAEALGMAPLPTAGALRLRRVAMELERIANHVGDLGALAGDVAFLPTASFCGRIRGEYLNMTASLCGNRFGRNLIRPGDRSGAVLDAKQAQKLIDWIARIKPELDNALTLLFDAPSALDRLENTGVVSTETARLLGGVGVAGRASALVLDARNDFPFATYRKIPRIEVGSGDVMARALVRRSELEESHKLLLEDLRAVENMTENVPDAPLKSPQPDSIAIGCVEAWRGELFHAALTDGQGKFSTYRIVDPSFHNWYLLSMALRGEEISNFPICNKSFNLSYCGHDL
ncbi:MAG: hypothetical protein PHS41_03400 [Victivallaceae bacterium]|nr:hypothetical protein [Victivallaceae bacterium]